MANVKFTDLANLGNITANTIIPVVDSNVNYTVTASELQDYVNTTTGNISANYFVGNGSLLTGLPATYGNANVADYLPVNSANVQANFISAIGNITGSYILGNGSQLTGLPATYGNSNVAAYLLTNTGNVSASYFLGNGSLLTGIPAAYTNANVATFLSAYGSNVISTTGNISGGYFLGDGSQLTNLPAGILSGNLTGNISGNGFGILNAATVTATGDISTTGNITGGNINGNLTGSGANLTGIVTSIVAGSGISVNAATGAVTVTNNNPVYNNSNVAAYLPTYTGNIGAAFVTATGNITANNISVGNTVTITNTTAPKVRLPAGASIGAPTLLTYSPGARVIVYDSINNSTAGYAIGVESGNLWFGSDQAAVTGFKWYSGNVAVGSLTGSGNLSVTGTTTLNGYIETTTSGLTTSTSFTPAMTNGPVQRVTANGSFTLNAPTGMTAGQSITLVITQDATGSRVMTPNATYKFAYGVKTLSTAANSIDMMSIFYDGSNYLCNLVKGYTA